MTAPGTDREATSSGERWVVVGGLGMAVASLVPWYRAGELGFTFDGPERTNGWQEPDSSLSVMATVLGAALTIVVLVANRQRSRPRFGTVSWGTLLTALSAVVVGLVALKFSLNTEHTTVGVYLALTAAVTQLYGAYVTRMEEPAATTPRPAPPQGGPEPAGWAQPQWPETGYFLANWLRPGVDVANSVVAYRRAFAHDAARQARLVEELRRLLDPGRPDAERAAVFATAAPHVPPPAAPATLAALLDGLMRPPMP
jgi:hypothetical protein